MRRFTMLLTLLGLCAGCASVRSPEDAVARVGPQALIRDVVATRQSVVDASLKSGTPMKGDALIEEEHWAPSIRKLNPEYVYSDGMNIAIVLNTSPREESGVYVAHPFTSSGFNAHQDDEVNVWTGALIANGIYSFTRKGTHKAIDSDEE